MIGRAGWSVRAGALAWALGVIACAGRTPAPDSPVIIAGSVCSGVPGFGPETLGAPSPETAKPELLAAIREADEPTAATELVLVDLAAQRVLWRKPVRAAARPQILDDVVVLATTDRRLVAYDLASGAERFRHELDRPFWIGAAQSGKTILLTTRAASYDPRERGSSLIALDAESGSERWSREVPYDLTRPVVRGNRALVVADHADLWALELGSGASIACSSIGGNTVEWIESDGSSLYLGATEARMLGPDARPLATALQLPRTDLPGRPFFRESSYQPQPAARSAHGRVGVVAPLTTQRGEPALATDGFFFVFYRDVFGFRADGRIAWAQLLESDVVRARATSSGLWLLTETGELARLSAATGEVVSRFALGGRVASADLRVEPLRSQPSAADAPPPPAASLQASLKRVAGDTDARLLPARLLAVDELARLETSSATADLLEIYSAPNTPRGLQERIEKRMRERTLGGDVLIAALDRHEDFLDDHAGPPLRAIVPGLVTQNEKRALPALVDHLFDPDTSLSDLSLLVSAIDSLGGEAGRAPLRRFFEMYRADSSLAGDPHALALAAEALVARGGANERAVLEATRDSPLAAAALRERLSVILQPPAATAADPATAPVEVAAQPEPPVLALRAQLDAARPAFEPCLSAAQARTPKLSSVWLRFIAQPDGRTREVHVSPNDPALARCLAEQLATLKLTSDRKQLTSYRLVLQPLAAPVEAATEAPGEPTFWARAEQRASKTAKRPATPPWWKDQNPLFLAVDSAPPPVQLLPAKAAPAAAPQAGRTSGQTTSTEAATSTPAPPVPSKSTPTPSPGQGDADAWWTPVQAPNAN